MGEIEAGGDPLQDIMDHLVAVAGLHFTPAAGASSAQHRAAGAALCRRDPAGFLANYGCHLALPHLAYFEHLAASEPDELAARVAELRTQLRSGARRIRVRNRRYRALRRLCEEGEYFSESAMRARDPLLYEQLVGRYLTAAERRARDSVPPTSLVELVLRATDLRRVQDTLAAQRLAEPAHDHDDAAPVMATSLWGEFTQTATSEPRACAVSAVERRALRDEFVSEMHHRFLEGLDEDFDYDSLDRDESLDDLSVVEQDAHDRYFEEEEECVRGEASPGSGPPETEDELDVYMRHLNKVMT